MAPKRKKAAAAPATKKAKAAKAAAAKPVKAPAKPAKAASPAAKKSGKLSVQDAWADPEIVTEGVMTQVGFGVLCTLLEIEEMSFEAVYLLYTLVPSAEEDAMTVCCSASKLREGLQKLGCRELTELPRILLGIRTCLEEDYESSTFLPFFKWIFDLGKGIASLNNGAHHSAVRSVPLDEGLVLMESALSKWKLLPQFKHFCTSQCKLPFSKDVWVQIGRFANMTKTGQISADLSNYDDDDTGGGNAWPCMIDDFVDFFRSSGDEEKNEVAG